MRFSPILILFCAAAPSFAASASVSPAARTSDAVLGRSVVAPELPGGPVLSLQSGPELGVKQTLGRFGTLLIQSAESQRAVSAPVALAPGVIGRPVRSAAFVAGVAKGKSLLGRATTGLRTAVKRGEASGSELDAFYDRLSGRRETSDVLAAPVSPAALLAAPAGPPDFGRGGKQPGRWAAAALPIAGGLRAAGFLAQAPGFFSVHAHAVAFSLLSLALLIFAVQAYMANRARTDYSIYMDPPANFASVIIYGGLTATTLIVAAVNPAALASIFPFFIPLSVIAGIGLVFRSIPEDDVASLMVPLATFLLLTWPALYVLGIPVG